MAILVVDDDQDLLDVLCFTLRRGGYEVLRARDGGAALQLARSKSLELILLDIELPGLSGWEVCKKVREESNTPIIIVTAAHREEEVVRGLELGADDYITKPFGPHELLARIRAVGRRTDTRAVKPQGGPQAVSAGDLALDPQMRLVTIGGREIRLTPTEFKLLHELVLHEGQVLTYRLLSDRVWGYDDLEDSAMLRGHIRNLRSKLGDDSAAPTYVHTVSGIGYTFRRRTAEVASA